MARQTKRKKVKTEELVTVAQTRDEEEAREYETLLVNDNIPAQVNIHEDVDTSQETCSVLVPERCVDEAFVVIESQDAYDDFYDMALDDEDDYGSGLDLVDEDF